MRKVALSVALPEAEDHWPYQAHRHRWNHNVEFIEQEENWERPAVFVEFCPIQWNAIVPGVEYRAEPLIKLHIVTDWEGSSAEGSELQEDALRVFDLSGLIHAQLAGLSGETFLELDSGGERY